ncbi:MAG: sugar ABC transporter permease [Clostridia bacterium]|nr:sugar ABC transporter permease [Clostridia bacterium]
MAKKIVKQKKKLAHSGHSGGFLSFERRRNIEGFLFSVPWLFGFTWFILIPLLLSVRISFFSTVLTDPYGFEGTSTWVGFDNYVEIVKTPEYGQTVIESFLTALYQVPVIVGFALFVAVLLKQDFPGRVYYRVIFFIPVILCGVIMSYLFADSVGSVSVFSTLVSTNSGVLSRVFGGRIISTITSGIGTIMWKSSVEILIFLAALQSVPAILYEVVELDGATAWESFWHVTLPYISPFVILNCIYTMVDAFVDTSNPVMGIMTRLMNEGTKYGMASALSWMYMILTLLTILIFVLLTRRWLR